MFICVILQQIWIYLIVLTLKVNEKYKISNTKLQKKAQVKIVDW